MLTNDLPLKFDSCRRVKQQLPANAPSIYAVGGRICTSARLAMLLGVVSWKLQCFVLGVGPAQN